MPPRSAYATVATAVLAPYFDDAASVWKGFYKLLLWFEKEVPHIIDGDKLAAGIWRERAESVQKELAREFGCKVSEVASQIDQLIKSDIFDRLPQRQNPLGIGFVTSLHLALKHFSSPEYDFLPEEAIGKLVFQGIRKPPRDKPDLVVVRAGSEVAVISAKWSLRHDRLKDILDEADYFKRLSPRLAFYVITNEFDPARLTKVLDDYRIDGLFHVAKRLVTEVAGVDGRVHKMRDLSDLLVLFTN